MLNRQAQAASLERLDTIIAALTPSTETAPPQAASLGEWLLFAGLTIFGALMIIGSAGTLSAPVIAGLMIAYLGRTFVKLGSKALTTVRTLRLSIQSNSMSRILGRSRSWMYAPGGIARPTLNQRMGASLMKKLGMRMPQRVNGKIGYPAGGSGKPLPGGSGQVPPAATPPSNDSTWLSGAFTTAKKSLMPGTQKPPMEAIPNRTALAEQLINAESNKPFSQAVNMVNSNLASNGYADISTAKLGQYVQLTQDVDAGKISSTTAFFESAGGWVGDKTSSVPDRMVGALFNFGGAMFSGAQEADNLKKGLIFTSPSK